MSTSASPRSNARRLILTCPSCGHGELVLKSFLGTGYGNLTIQDLENGGLDRGHFKLSDIRTRCPSCGLEDVLRAVEDVQVVPVVSVIGVSCVYPTQAAVEAGEHGGADGIMLQVMREPVHGGVFALTQGFCRAQGEHPIRNPFVPGQLLRLNG